MSNKKKKRGENASKMYTKTKKELYRRKKQNKRRIPVYLIYL